MFNGLYHGIHHHETTIWENMFGFFFQASNKEIIANPSALHVFFSGKVLHIPSQFTVESMIVLLSRWDMDSCSLGSTFWQCFFSGKLSFSGRSKKKCVSGGNCSMGFLSSGGIRSDSDNLPLMFFFQNHSLSKIPPTGMSMVLCKWGISPTYVGWIRPVTRFWTNLPNFHGHPSTTKHSMYQTSRSENSPAKDF